MHSIRTSPPPKRFVYDPDRYGLFSTENKHLYTQQYTNDIFFVPEHLCEGLAYYLIDALRDFEAESGFTEQIKRAVLTSIEDDHHQIQKVLNSLFNPELHIPRALRTGNYTKIQFRNYTVLETSLYNHTELLPTYLTSKERCIDMLAQILDDYYNHNFIENKHIKTALKKIFSTIDRNDLPALKKAYKESSKWSKPDKPADLANLLCFKWNSKNRNLLLKEGIIKLEDPISTPYYNYNAKTMGELIKEKYG
ncbi:T3SS effector OspC family protein [uncultured Endozoicomonas sp.]|uniref:T3SS effector OspC family protein n=1 Tax=uncultured Endozoicomonas sp. TaxID=432652 RepID=UPI002630B0E7|nr:T3SS effector OspC family protein [uncultured Endozoicomonas sp.]